ncbi:MAG: hypothetical protein ACTSUG_15200 [Candidatus Helarchaeota archaeon]
MVIFDSFFQEKTQMILAENIVRDEMWELLKKNIRKGKEWYVLTPVNYDYFQVIDNLEMTRDTYIKTLKERLDFLKKNNERIQLLIHLNKIRKFLKKETQENKIKFAIQFLNSLNIKPTKLISIDNAYNADTLQIIKKYGIKEIETTELEMKSVLLKFLSLLRIKVSLFDKFQTFLKRKDLLSAFSLILGELIKVKTKTIHAEVLVHEEIWKNLLKKAIGQDYIWFVITPANYDYCNAYFELNLSKKKFIEILTKRIKKLKELGEQIELHVHLAKEKCYLANETQEKKFNEALEFLNFLDVYPTKFAAGWWIYNNHTIELAKAFGIKEIYDYTINPLKKPIIINDIKINFVHKYWHDFDFL